MATAKRIAAVSVPSAELDQIKALLERTKAQLARPWHWANEAEADVLLIDVDSVYGHMDWLRAHSAGRRIVALSAHRSADHDIVMARPVTAESLLRAFQALEGESAPAPASTAAAASPPPVAQAKPATAAVAQPRTTPAAAPPAQTMNTPPAPRPAPAAAAPAPAAIAEPAPAPKPALASEMTLIEYFTAEALPHAAKIALDGVSLTIDVATESYYGPTALKPLIPFCQGTIERRAWEVISPNVLQALRGAESQPLARLVWLFTLVNSNGQLLPGLDINGRFKLAKWPQIEREYPKHFRIATIMMKGPATLSDIADQSGAALADVVDFVNAYSATGFVSAEGVAPVAVEPIAPSGLIARLRARAKR